MMSRAVPPTADHGRRHASRGGNRPAPVHREAVVDGVRLHAMTEGECVDHIMTSLDAGIGGWVATPNLDHLRRCAEDRDYASLIDQADVRVADGMTLVWASRLQGTALPARVPGSDLILSLPAAAARRGRSVFFLGGDPGTADATADVLRRLHPALRIEGTHCPARNFERDPRAVTHVSTLLAEARPDIIFVALGSPKQEQLIHRIRSCCPRAWWLGVGISFSFVSGRIRRAPVWMQRCGLEWVHRIGQEPQRLWKRYLVHGIPAGLGLIARAGLRGAVSGATRFPRVSARTAVRIRGGKDDRGDALRMT